MNKNIMYYISIVRASGCFRIGCIEFSNRVIKLNSLLSKFKAVHRYHQKIECHNFYLFTNGHSRHWLFNETFTDPIENIGGFYQIAGKVYLLEQLDSALMPLYFCSLNFNLLDLRTLFIWIATNIKMLNENSFRPVTSEIKKIQYINFEAFVQDFISC